MESSEGTSIERVVGEVKLWDLATGKMKLKLEDKRELDYFSRFNAIAFSSDAAPQPSFVRMIEVTSDNQNKP